ncbi:uncharacterized protein BT62DRAFT_944549 [Guyanagaster necrorhizus]|uniref:DUF6534 domain-containing protein n=1 Tax=Guyanagaster necrorhizus TaxID=856835 RepID=A0A9P7VZQ2_9AGAR|nr:uncharacterized protein BT62DRAFT_944549 [Guyanagaster necrorhizus MCA 3950]KAG7449942.1 hypothetical protein BT62DRAFT_944549 [Guyanagaster necrorhizus MCA 3950]
MAGGSLNGTFGAFLIGVIMSSCLFGVTCTQTWYYFTRYSDSIAIKALVCTIWYSSLLIRHPILMGLHRILEVIHVAFTSYAIYYYVVLHYGNPPALAEIPVVWSVSLNIGVTDLITLLVYLFYARRIYYLSNHNVPLVAIIIVLSICRLGTSLGVTGYSIYLKYFILFARPGMKNLIRTSLILHVVTDLLVAVSLCYYLHKRRTGIKHTNTMINRLMVYAIHNGLITAIVDILVFAFNTAYPDNLVYLSVYQIVANLYSNSFLATLNARRRTKPNNDTDVDMLSLSTSGAHDMSFEDAPRTNTTNLRHINITISSTVETMGDMNGTSSVSACIVVTFAY